MVDFNFTLKVLQNGNHILSGWSKFIAVLDVDTLEIVKVINHSMNTVFHIFEDATVCLLVFNTA